MTDVCVATRMRSEAQPYAYVDQPISNGIADLRRISSSGESGRLTEEGRSKNIDRWCKVDIVQRIECGHAQGERVTAVRCPAQARAAPAAQAASAKSSNPPLRSRCRIFTAVFLAGLPTKSERAAEP